LGGLPIADALKRATAAIAKHGRVFARIARRSVEVLAVRDDQEREAMAELKMDPDRLEQTMSQAREELKLENQGTEVSETAIMQRVREVVRRELEEKAMENSLTEDAIHKLSMADIGFLQSSDAIG